MVSAKLRVEVKLSELKAYQIALKAGLHPSTLSRIVNGIERIRPQDERVLAIGRVLGLQPHECFEGEKDEKDGAD